MAHFGDRFEGGRKISVLQLPASQHRHQGWVEYQPQWRALRGLVGLLHKFDRAIDVAGGRLKRRTRHQKRCSAPYAQGRIEHLCTLQIVSGGAPVALFNLNLRSQQPAEQ